MYQSTKPWRGNRPKRFQRLHKFLANCQLRTANSKKMLHFSPNYFFLEQQIKHQRTLTATGLSNVKHHPKNVTPV